MSLFSVFWVWLDFEAWVSSVRFRSISNKLTCQVYMHRGGANAIKVAKQLLKWMCRFWWRHLQRNTTHTHTHTHTPSTRVEPNELLQTGIVSHSSCGYSDCKQRYKYVSLPVEQKAWKSPLLVASRNLSRSWSSREEHPFPGFWRLTATYKNKREWVCEITNYAHMYIQHQGLIQKPTQLNPTVTSTVSPVIHEPQPSECKMHVLQTMRVDLWISTCLQLPPHLDRLNTTICRHR